MKRDFFSPSNAELFYRDLVGWPTRRPRPQAPPPVTLDAEYAVVDVGEAVPMGGRGTFRHDPLGGDGDNVAARWNVESTTAAGATIDLVVYLHGHGAPAADFLDRKANTAGLDMLDASGAVRVRASRPTLALIPRGRHVVREAWVFDRIPNREAFDALTAAGLEWLATRVLGLAAGSRLNPGRLTLMAHSGGGEGMSRLLAPRTGDPVNPQEVVCFDCLYGGESAIQRWVTARLNGDDATRGGLRVFYTPCSASSWSQRGDRWLLQSTEVSSRRVQETLARTLRRASGSAALADRYRVQIAGVRHGDIPARFAPLLLENVGAPVPNARPVPPASQRPRCVANDDWLQRTVRPGDTPPAAPPGTPAPAGTPAPRPAENLPESSEYASFEDLEVEQLEGEDLAVEDFEYETAGPDGAGVENADLEAFDGDDADGEVVARDDAGEVEWDTEAVYSAPGARAYTPSRSVAVFRTPPRPVGVSPATEWPETTADPDAAFNAALRALGVNASSVSGYAGAGVTAMRPVASAFGERALTELLSRLRYTPPQLASPPHSYDNRAQFTRAFGATASFKAVLAVRALLEIPGHFRELARRAGSEEEAYGLENLGWLMMQSLAAAVRTASTMNFWLPASPSFVTPFPTPLPSLSPQVSALATSLQAGGPGTPAAEYTAKFNAWRTGAPGRQWRLETGRDTAAGGGAAGAPFYPQLFTNPPTIPIDSERRQVRGAWARRVAAFDAGTSTAPLDKCDNSFLTPLRLMGPIQLRGLQLRGRFPSPASATTLTELTGLAVLAPAFEAVFRAIAELGWNDLLFETQGMGCFRGKKIPGDPAAARQMSEHSLGIAIDVNVFENGQNTTGSMDPRIVAVFEAFRFAWGRGFPTPDPMHFEYRG